MEEEEEEEEEEAQNSIEREAIPKTASKKEKTRIVDKYAAQCDRCLKWRVIGKQEEYEEIRIKLFKGQAFFCEQKAGTFCQVDDDVRYDATTCTWTIEKKPGLPRIPKGFTRSLVLRADTSKVDSYYITDDEARQRFRTLNQVLAFLETRPDQYEHLSAQDFNFEVPKVLETTVFANALKRNTIIPPDTACNYGRKTTAKKAKLSAA